MTQMWLLSWPKNTSSTTKSGGDSGVSTDSSTTNAIKQSGATNSCCASVKKLLRKVKRQGRVVRGATASRQSSFQCRYDPLSYSLNFDTSGYGSLSDDEDYHRFCAFSTKFLANPKTSSSPRLL
ncbi:hypothetical protein CFOL_v3_24559 [Cephalotus follicularis]|uniref:Uncharacterized protein n=1 Tax=Cephalotus follicularis TaxID=3775 RepID=A0A1Q3CLH4_CEPFO|nr:hypothetical protein CFOL_v3_24559 [Cephalotus follicularis]